MIDEIRKKVYELLSNDKSGHDVSHIKRVENLASSFAIKENANVELTLLIALLHDVDDYKLFGLENEKDLPNAKHIMDTVGVDKKTQKIVLKEISHIGYRKLLQGLRPTTLEGQIVSDADMCDGIGATAIIRTCTYELSHNKPFFDKEIFPNKEVNVDNYKLYADSGVIHCFEKLLKLKYLMLTESGRCEATNRQKIMVDFLYNLFLEENEPKWISYLEEYLKELENTNN